MASIWDILGLDGPTAERKDIKRAYARKLKATRPEDDPDGFMALRQAHDQALNYAKYQAEFGDVEVNVPAETVADNTESSNTSASDQSDVEPRTIAEPPVTTIDIETISASRTTKPREPSFSETMRQRINALLSSPWKRVNKSEWDQIFSDTDLESIDNAQDFEWILIDSLLERFASDDADETQNRRNKTILTAEIATYIFDQMSWHDLRDRSIRLRHAVEFIRENLDVFNRDTYQPGDYIGDDDGDDIEDQSWPELTLYAGIVVVLYLLFKFLSAWAQGKG